MFVGEALHQVGGVEPEVFGVEPQKTACVKMRRELVITVQFEVAQAVGANLGGARGHFFRNPLFDAGFA